MPRLTILLGRVTIQVHMASFRYNSRRPVFGAGQLLLLLSVCTSLGWPAAAVAQNTQGEAKANLSTLIQTAYQLSELQGRQYYQTQQYDKALNSFQELLPNSNKPHEEQAHAKWQTYTLLGLTYRQLIQHQTALKTFQEVLALQKKELNADDPRIAWTLSHLMAICQNLGDYPLFKQYSADYGNILSNLVQQHESKTQRTARVVENETLSPLEGEYSPKAYYVLLGAAYVKRHEDVKAQQAFQGALQEAARSGQSQSKIEYAMAMAAQQAGQLTDAETHYQKTLSLLDTEKSVDTLSRARMYLSAGQFYFYLGKLEDARPYLAKALSFQAQCPSPLEIVFMQSRYLLKKLDNIKFTPDYAADLATPSEAGKTKHAKITRWHDNTRQIRVYIANGNALQGWQPDYVQMVKTAFQTWNDVLGNRFDIVYTNDAKAHDIQVNWHPNARKMPFFNSKDTPWWAFDVTQVERMGENEIASTTQGKLVMNHLNITLADSSGSVYPAKTVRHTILHEVGHSFGILGHSNNPADLMYEGVPIGFETAFLSPRDRATLKSIYMQKADVSNDPQTPVSYSYYEAVKQGVVFRAIDF